MKAPSTLAILVAIGSLCLPACEGMHAEEGGEGHHEHHNIVLTSPTPRNVVITQKYVCLMHSRKNIEIKALEEGYLEEITVKEGQAVKKGEVLFRVVPVLYNARLAAEKAEAELAQIEYEQTKNLAKGDRPVVSQTEVALYKAKLEKALAKVKLAEAELDFAIVKAPFDGIIDRLLKQEGSLVKAEEVLTTLSDNSVMWVYFNVPEARYLEYMAGPDQEAGPDQGTGVMSREIELQLADGSTFPQTGTIGAIEAQFNNETGTIPFRADFPNPKGLLRHGQTGNVLIHKTLENAVVIPQRATFEILDKQYVYVVGEDHVVHQRPITIEHELEDIYVIREGLGFDDKIVLDGVRQVHDGDKLEEFEFRKPEEALEHQKFHAE